MVRRSIVRPDERGQIKRSSSLPPAASDASTTSSVTTSASRGRSANPIGLSKQSKALKATNNNTNDQNCQRSQSLTRAGSFSEVRRSSTSNSGGLQRQNSFTSVGSTGSAVFEPMWFSHAFHGSGACTCGVDHEGRACDAGDVDGDGDASGDDAEDGPKSDHDDSEKSAADCNNNSSSSDMNKDGDSNTEITAVESDSYNSSSTSTGTNDSSTNSTSNHHSTTTASSYEHRHSAITSTARTSTIAASADGNSTITSFTAQDASIQSELLKDGELNGTLGELSYRPKTDRKSRQQQQQQRQQRTTIDNDISSITMDDLPNTTSASAAKANANDNHTKAKKSKSFVNNMKNKIKQRSKSFHNNANPGGEFEQSESSLNSQSTADSKSSAGRRRGRSLVLKMRRNTATTINEGKAASANAAAEQQRRSRSQTQCNTIVITGGGDDNQKGDKRVRERSRSIVRDARSFIESIDNSYNSTESNEDAPPQSRGLHRRDSVDSNTSTIASGNITSSGHRKANAIITPPSRNSGGGVFLRNQFRDKQTLQNKPRSSTVSKDDSSTSTNDNSALDQSQKTIELISSLEETNLQNESTIQDLKEQLIDLTMERNAFRNNSERMMEITTKQKSQLERELRSERKGFADVSHGHKREIIELKTKSKRMERKCKKMEGDMKEIVEKEIYSLNSRDGPLEEESSLFASSLGIDVSASLSTNASQAERNLYRALLKLSEMESKHNSQLEQVESDKESMKEQADELKGKHDDLEMQHHDLLDERDKEATVVNALENKLEGCRLVIESMQKNNEESIAALDASSSAVNDELVEKIGDLAEENCQLLIKCQNLERDLSTSNSALDMSLSSLSHDLEMIQMKNREATATIETLQAENRNLRMSFANQGKSSRDAMVEIEEEDSKPVTKMEHKEALETIHAMQANNDVLYESMEEAIQMASGMDEKMAGFVTAHESSAQDYGSKVASLKEELNQALLSKEVISSKMEVLIKENKKLSIEIEEANSLVVCSVRDEIKREHLSKGTWNREKRELSSAMDGLKKENEKLHESIKEMNNLVTTAEECVCKLNQENASLKDTQEYYMQQLQELNVEKEANAYLQEEIQSVSAEREEAYNACKVLQQEINMLSKSLKETKGHVERLHSDESLSSEDNQEKLAELTTLNKLLNKELELKNDALQAVQSALENLKDEQSTIKETIVELRMENVKLRDTTTASSLLPPPPKSILKQSKSFRGDGSDSSQFLKLETRIKKVEKENKGLREANNTLSAKLFDEMEKTDALRVANEGLAARICKLVAFIQQTPGGRGPAAVGGGTSSSSGGTKSKRSKSPASPKKKKQNVMAM